MRKCYSFEDNRENEPIFPYPNIENNYDEDPENPKWNYDYPLIKTWNEAWNKWDDKRDENMIVKNIKNMSFM